MIVVCSSCGAKNRVPEARLDGQARCAATSGKRVCKQPIVPLRRPVAVGAAADFDALIGSSPLPVLVDFWAAWCGPCRAVAPELEKLAADRAGRVVVAKLDTDALPQVAGRYGIRGIPTMILFDGGRERSRVSGAMSAAELARRLGLD